MKYYILCQSTIYDSVPQGIKNQSEGYAFSLPSLISLPEFDLSDDATIYVYGTTLVQSQVVFNHAKSVKFIGMYLGLRRGDYSPIIGDNYNNGHSVVFQNSVEGSIVKGIALVTTLNKLNNGYGFFHSDSLGLKFHACVLNGNGYSTGVGVVLNKYTEVSSCILKNYQSTNGALLMSGTYSGDASIVHNCIFHTNAKDLEGGLVTSIGVKNSLINITGTPNNLGGNYSESLDDYIRTSVRLDYQPKIYYPLSVDYSAPLIPGHTTYYDGTSITKDNPFSGAYNYE